MISLIKCSRIINELLNAWCLLCFAFQQVVKKGLVLAADTDDEDSDWLLGWETPPQTPPHPNIFVLFLICKQTCSGICYTIKVTKKSSMMFLVYSLVNIATHVIPPSIAYVDPPSRGAEGKKRERGTWRASYAGYMLLSGLLV